MQSQLSLIKVSFHGLVYAKLHVYSLYAILRIYVNVPNLSLDINGKLHEHNVYEKKVSVFFLYIVWYEIKYVHFVLIAHHWLSTGNQQI